MIMVPDSVLQSDLLTPSEKLLFPQLVVLCGAEGITKAENDELARTLGISERSASGFITNLNRAGFITVTVDRKLKTNQRTIRLNELTQDFALSPVLLQKLMLADADSCVKLAQILASALPDAKSCVMLAQNLASTIKEECADSESINTVDAKSCVNPGQNSSFSDKRDNIYNNIIYNTQKDNINTTVNSFAQNPENADLTQNLASTPEHYITLNGERIAPESLGQLLNLRGIEDSAVAPFVEAHAGRSYNDLNELRDLVRKWLKRTKPKAPKKSVAQRRFDFREKIREYDRQNPKKYPPDHYNDFFTYWTTANKDGTVMRFEKDNFFDLPAKLAYAYKTIYLKNQTYASNTNNGNKPGKQYGFVSADDLAGNTTDADALAADSAGESETETAGHGLKTIFIDLE